MFWSSRWYPEVPDNKRNLSVQSIGIRSGALLRARLDSVSSARMSRCHCLCLAAVAAPHGMPLLHSNGGAAGAAASPQPNFPPSLITSPLTRLTVSPQVQQSPPPMCLGRSATCILLRSIRDTSPCLCSVASDFCCALRYVVRSLCSLDSHG